jgi:hypothetical protein
MWNTAGHGIALLACRTDEKGDRGDQIVAALLGSDCIGRPEDAFEKVGTVDLS